MSDTSDRSARSPIGQAGAYPSPGLGPDNDFVPFPPEDVERGIPSRFERQVAEGPDRLAVKDGRTSLTYDELNRSANRLARAILARGADRSRPVAVLLPHGTQAIVAILAALKAGRIYVAIDPSHPRERVEYLLEDSQADLLVSNDALLPALDELAPRGFPLMNADHVDPGLADANLSLPLAPDAIAGIFYTSGSTGRPKGVIFSHRATLHGKRTLINAYHLCPTDRVAQTLSFSMSASLNYFLSPLLVGAATLPFDVRNRGLGALARWLRQEKITFFYAVPTIFRKLMAAAGEGEGFPSVRLLALGGETILRHDVDLFRKHFADGCWLRIGLGMTEAGGATATRLFIGTQTPLPGDGVPAGYPTEGTDVLLLDENGREVAEGQVGEIALKGRYLASGYWRRPELTAEKFLPDPDGTDARIFLTGDLGRRTAEGCILHMGRRDFRVKISGQRVETAEVEAVLLELGAFSSAAVTARPDELGNNRLIAYLVPKDAGAAPTAGELWQRLGQKLPTYMIPSAFVMMEELPMTAGGKVDRSALPDPDAALRHLSAPFVAPRTPLERSLAEMWAQVRRRGRVGVTDSFLELGGTSLEATQLLQRAQDAFGVTVPLSAFFQQPTVEGLALKVLEGMTRAERSDTLPEGGEPPDKVGSTQ
jgi:amino acid adenylation domain-containing protein